MNNLYRDYFICFIALQIETLVSGAAGANGVNAQRLASGAFEADIDFVTRRLLNMVLSIAK